MPRNKSKPHSTNWQKWPRDQKEALYLRYLDEEARERARDLESRGAAAWYTEMFGPDSGQPIPLIWADLAPHHIEALTWHWNAMAFKRAGWKVKQDAYFAIWPRGHMKSTIARYIAVADACLSGTGYCLYVSGTKSKVRGHAISLEALITSKRVQEYYPRLSQVKKGERDQSKGWTADFIYTDAGYVFHFVSLDQGVAGANIESVRPSLIIPDDVDDRDASPVISETRARVLTTSVIPTRQAGTLVFWAQNLISRHSVLYKAHKGELRILVNRVPTKPIPAFIDLQTVERLIDGQIHDVIVGGTPTWAWYDRERGQEEIDAITLPAFLTECQQEVELDKSGVILQEYSEEVHVITWLEFNLRYGLPPDNREIPPHWKRYIGHDWGSSGVEAGHACVVCYLAVAAQNSALPGMVFLYKASSYPASVLAGTVAHDILDHVLADCQTDPRTYIEFALLDRATGNPGDALAVATRTRVIQEIARRTQWAMFHMSHEQRAVRDVYKIVYGLPFQPCNPKRDGGVAQLRHHLRTDMTAPHEFRVGRPGFTRMYLIVEDDEARTRPRNDAGLKLVRDQLPEWRWRPPTLTNAGYLDERPMKIHDDVGNALMMVFTHFKMAATPLTRDEQVVAGIPEELRYDSLLANSPFERGLTPEQELAHLMAIAQAKKRAKPWIQRFGDDA